MQSALKSCQKRNKKNGFYYGAQNLGKGERRDPFIKRTAMFVVSLKGINYELWSHLTDWRVHCRTPIVLAVQVLFRLAHSNGLCVKKCYFLTRCLRTWESSVFQFPFALPTLSVEVFTVTPVMSGAEELWSLTFSLPLLLPGLHGQCNLQLQYNEMYVFFFFVLQERFLFHCHINTQL